MDTTLNRNNRSIENVLLMLRPILEEKEVIRKTITMTELAKICRNHKGRLPLRHYRAKDMASEIRDAFRLSKFFQLGDLDIDTFSDVDVNGRRNEMIDFQYSVSKEQQYLNSLKSTPTQIINESTNH